MNRYALREPRSDAAVRLLAVLSDVPVQERLAVVSLFCAVAIETAMLTMV